MKSRLLFKRTSLYFTAAVGVGAVTYKSLTDSNALVIPSRSELSTGFPLIYCILRSSRALSTIAVNVVDYKYSLIGLQENSDEYHSVLSQVHLRSARRVLRLCEANKGFYVKAGQFVAAVRQVPKEYSSTLSALQDQAAPWKFEAIKEWLVSSLGQDLSDIFLSFDEHPVAAASVAQVHHAVLKDQQEVAVKVQYPGLKNQMKFDLSTMSFLSELVSLLFPEYRFEWLVSEFAKSITVELDFIQEAKNSQRTARNFEKNSMVRVPHILWDLTTTHVLTMQFCRGHKVDDLEFLKQAKISPAKVAKALSDVVAEMVFVHGFLHGDLHPGNVLVSPKAEGDFSLVLLDFGICKELDDGFRLKYCQLWKALIFLDSNRIQELGKEMGAGKYSTYFPVIFTGRTIGSKSALGKGMSAEEKNNLKQELRSLKMEDISSFMESLPSEFLTVLRTDGLLRSLISKLGAPQRVRLRSYAKCALRGLSTNATAESDSVSKMAITRFKIGIENIQLVLLFDTMELIALVENFRHSFIKVSKKFLDQLAGVIRIFFPPSILSPSIWLPGALVAESSDVPPSPRVKNRDSL